MGLGEWGDLVAVRRDLLRAGREFMLLEAGQRLDSAYRRIVKTTLLIVFISGVAAKFKAREPAFDDEALSGGQ